MVGAKHTALEGAFRETDVVAAFRVEGMSPSTWSTGPGDAYARHSHTYHKVLYCLRGSIVFRLDSGEEIALAPGDRLDLPPGTAHRAVVGPDGVTCAEAARLSPARGAASAPFGGASSWCW
jgi:quercetin dioxygenase-like cupin family protein